MNTLPPWLLEELKRRAIPAPSVASVQIDTEMYRMGRTADAQRLAAMGHALSTPDTEEFVVGWDVIVVQHDGMRHEFHVPA